jgi:serine/threonine protein kinase
MIFFFVKKIKMIFFATIGIACANRLTMYKLLSVFNLGVLLLAAGLQVLQEKNLIHRDLKPQVFDKILS